MTCARRDPAIQVRLDAWAAWLYGQHERGAAGLSPLARLMDMAAGRRVTASGEGGYRSRVPVDDLECALTDRAVRTLPADLRAAVARWHGRGEGETMEALARELNVVKMTLHRRLCQADVRIAEWLRQNRMARPAAETF